MRKIFLFMVTSLDGFFEGPDHDLSWHNVDLEFNKFAVEQLELTDTLLFGHRTYDLFKDFWPNAHKDPNISREDLTIADFINKMPKIVFSRTLKKVEEGENWKNVELKNKVDPQEIKKLKEKPGKNIVIFGSNNLCVSLMKEGLVDEFRVMVNPVVIGEGTRLFKGLDKKLSLKLVNTREFKNGNILLYYQPAS